METRTRGRMRELVASELRATLARQRISAAELARRLGWAQSYMARRIDGRVALDMDDLEGIADALGVKIVDLLPQEVRPNAGLVRVAERPVPAPTRCAPDVRSPSIGGVHRRPKARQLATQPIAA